MTKRTWHVRAAGLTLATSAALSLGLSGNAFAQEDTVVELDNPSVSTSAEKDSHLEGDVLREETIPTGTAVDPNKYKLKKWTPVEGVEFAPNPEIKKEDVMTRVLTLPSYMTFQVL